MNLAHQKSRSRSRSRERQKNTKIPQNSPGNANFIREEDFDANQELIRSLLRIQQNREKPIDKFVKIVWIYKDKLPYDPKVASIMQDPKKYLDNIPKQAILQMLQRAQGQLRVQQKSHSKYVEFWQSLIELLQYKISQKSKKNKLKPQFKVKIKEMLQKPIEQLQKIDESIAINMDSLAFNSEDNYWHAIRQKIKSRRLQHRLRKYYQQFRSTHQEVEEDRRQREQQHQQDAIMPTLIPISAVNPKLVITQQAEDQQRIKLAEKIFKEEFQKGRQLLDNNLSLPKNHNLLSSDIITQQTHTYDFISKEIIEFEKYKRMEEDEQTFDDWVPIETEGRFRDRKPEYLNRVRVAYEENKLRPNGPNNDNPPPKTVQGYKFNIFYSDLYDKYKTPQYYLQPTENPDYCLIKFKAGPPYKDIAFRILRKQWDFSKKSGFQSIFSKGILQLYFNIKKPRLRV